MLEINYTVFIQIANFLILLFLLNTLLFKPIRKILSQRNDQMDSFQKIIENFKNKFFRHEKDLEQNMIEARKEGHKEKDGLKGEGLAEEREMLQEAFSSTEKKIDKARNEIQVKLVDVGRALQSEVDVFSKELAEKILGRSI